MEKCVVCGRTGNEVRLFDGFYVNNMAQICERCSLINNIPIVKRPSTGQLKESEKPYSVRARLSRMAHLSPADRKDKLVTEQLRELEENPTLEKPSEDELVFNLVDNFHWVLQTARRRQGLTTRQLAEKIGESEHSINLLEKKIVPREALNLLVKIEQLLKIKLIKKDVAEIERELKKQKEKKEFEAERAMYLKNQEKVEDFNDNSIQILEPGKILPPEVLALRARESRDVKMLNLKRESDKIDSDFDYSKKTRADVGGQQTRGFGSVSPSKKSGTPSIYDLMKQKQERDKTAVTGKDIQPVDDAREFRM